MDPGPNRVAQVFVWKQGEVPDFDYARQLLSVVNPAAYRAVSTDNSLIRLFSVTGTWPEQFWPRALQDMRQTPSPGSSSWTDTSRYDLSGWQGTDTRTGDKLFVVSVQTHVPGPETFMGEGVQTPPYAAQSQQPVVQVPYYPQYPTGPLAWPPPVYNYPYQSGAPPGIYGQPMAFPYGAYNPMVTGPLAPANPQFPVMVGGSNQPEGVPVALPDSYAPFYAGFGERLMAALIDFFFLSLMEGAVLGLIAALVFSARSQVETPDLFAWLGLYGPFACIGLLIFTAYHVIGWTAYGRTFGKWFLNMRIVRADGMTPSFGRSMLRMLGYFFSASLAFMGFILIAFDLRRQGLHDKMAETYVVPDKPAVPAPAGLPGYKVLMGSRGQEPPRGQPLATPAPSSSAPAMGMAAISPTETYDTIRVTSPAERVARPPAEPVARPQEGGTASPGGSALEGRSTIEEPESGVHTHATDAFTTPAHPVSHLSPDTEALLDQAVRERPERGEDVDRARTLFKEGLNRLEVGSRQGYSGMEVEPSAARAAATFFHQALELVPSAVAYRYFYAVALRYAEGFEVAIPEFRQVLELDPGHYEAQQQVALGPRWHDAYAYPEWGEPSPVEPGEILTDPVRRLLSQPHRPGTRLVLLREGSNKMVVALSRTRRDTWANLPTTDMPARIELVLTRSPHGPIVAVYVVIRDDPENPYKGETFLNPHDSGQPSDDACQLGQHMLAQLARQDHTYLLFVDENDTLLMSRRLVFDTATQVNIARITYEVQTLHPMVMDASRFTQAAQWHMDNFSLDQIKP